MAQPVFFPDNWSHRNEFSDDFPVLISFLRRKGVYTTWYIHSNRPLLISKSENLSLLGFGDSEISWIDLFCGTSRQKTRLMIWGYVVHDTRCVHVCKVCVILLSLVYTNVPCCTCTRQWVVKLCERAGTWLRIRTGNICMYECTPLYVCVAACI